MTSHVVKYKHFLKYFYKKNDWIKVNPYWENRHDWS
jgi:hypothetical protein